MHESHFRHHLPYPSCHSVPSFFSSLNYTVLQTSPMCSILLTFPKHQRLPHNLIHVTLSKWDSPAASSLPLYCLQTASFSFLYIHANHSRRTKCGFNGSFFVIGSWPIHYPSLKLKWLHPTKGSADGAHLPFCINIPDNSAWRLLVWFWPLHYDKD